MKIRITEIEANAEELSNSNTLSQNLNRMLAKAFAPKYERWDNDECGFDFQYEISTDNMNTLADALLRSKCEVDAKWIPCSERLPSEDGCYLVCMNFEYNNMDVLKWADGWNCFRYPDGKVSRESEIDRADVLAWMPLPTPYKGGDTE